MSRLSFVISEAIQRHFCLSWVAQSVLQHTPCRGGKSERFEFARNQQQTIGQRLYTLAHEALLQVLQLMQVLLAQGQSMEQVLEVIMPA